MPAWCRPCAKCPRSRHSWGCRGFFLSAFWRRCVWRRWCSGRRLISGRRVACQNGPGRCVCRWAAARPRDRHTRACGSEWSISRPALALPPPTGTAAWPSGPSGALHTGGAWLLMCYWVRCFEARPGPAPRRVPYLQFRMQFPGTCSSLLSEKPGISTITFQSMKCAWGNCMRICADQASPPPTAAAAWPPVPPAPSNRAGLGAIAWQFRMQFPWGCFRF